MIRPLTQHPRRRRGDLFMLGLDVFFLVAIILIFWKLSDAFTNPNDDEGIGTRQTAALHTYAISEQMLLYLDEAAKFAAHEALAETMQKGVKFDAGTTRSNACKTYAGYELWNEGDAACFPVTSTARRDMVTKAFEAEFRARLERKLLFPGFPKITYRIDTTSADFVTITGMPDRDITLPIVTAKGVPQSDVRDVILRDNIIRARQSAFAPDTRLPARAEPSPVSEPRTTEPKYVIIHATRTGELHEAVSAYRDGVQSTHYLIDAQGAIIQLVPESDAALHMPGCDDGTCDIGGKRLSTSAIEQQSISITLVNAGPIVGKTDGKQCPDARYVPLAPTDWCALHKGAACKTDTTQRCWMKYPPEQLDALQHLLADLMARRGMGAQNVLLEEQVLLGSDNPGPALTSTKDGKPVRQQEWLAQLLRQASAEAAATKTKEDASPAQQPTSQVALGSDLTVQFPLKTADIISCFGERYLKTDGGKKDFHEGIDFPASPGASIYPIADGTVVQVITSCKGECECSTRGKPACSAACVRVCPSSGNMILIKHTNNLYSRYMHLKAVHVTQGQAVSRTQVIGTVGNTGGSEGPHLDLRVYTSDPQANPKSHVNPLCIYPESVLKTVRFANGAESCTNNRYKTPFASNDPVLLEECKNIPSFSSAPGCDINSGASAGGEKLAIARERLAASPGMKVIEDAAKQANIDPRLLIALLAQESVGEADVLNSGGFVGLGQLGVQAAKDEDVAKILGSAPNEACKCPAKKNEKGEDVLTKCHAADVPACKGDPRLDPEKNARATAIYLRNNMNVFNGHNDQVRFGIASYNRGATAITNAIATAAKDSNNPTWEQVAPHVAQQGREYVPAVLSSAYAQGYSLGAAYGDQTCNAVNVKEVGTYTFTPSFTVEMPNLFTQMSRTAKWASDTARICDGKPENDEDVGACLRKRTGALASEHKDLQAVQCEIEANTSVVESLAEAIRDCRDNLQELCTCAWKPPNTIAGKELVIDIYANTEPRVSIDGTALSTMPESLNKPAGDAGARFQQDTDDAPSQRVTRYTFTYKDNALVSGTMRVWDENGKEAQYPASNITLFKPDDDISWIANATAAPACGLFKRMYRVCAGVTHPIYVQKRGESINPIIRFALDLDEPVAPQPVQDLRINAPALGTGLPGVPIVGAIGDAIVAMSTDKLELSFNASKSGDVSYYMVRCEQSPQPFGETFDFSYARTTVAGPSKTGAVHVTLDNCNNKPIVGGQCVTRLPTGLAMVNAPGCYKVEVTPVDMTGNAGTPVVYDQAVAARAAIGMP